MVGYMRAAKKIVHFNSNNDAAPMEYDVDAQNDVVTVCFMTKYVGMM